MDTGLDTNLDAPPAAAGMNPDIKWVLWGVWAGLSLLAVLLAVLVGGFDPALLLGWAVGIIVAAMLIVFARK